MRGIDYVNLPTSLIGQVDAAIGGKVAVNHPRAKNFIGAFHHPLGVLIDPDLLDSLPTEEIRNGLAEVVKVAMVHDADLFSLMEEEGTALLNPRAASMGRIISTAVRAKIALLEPDPFEEDLRRVLNFGHTFAHPLEVERGYGGLRHGYAVAIGMSIASRVAHGRGSSGPDVSGRLRGLLHRLGLPTVAPNLDPREVWDHANVVRHIRGDQLNFVIPTDVGQVEIVNDLEEDEFLAAYPDPKVALGGAPMGERT